MTKPREMKCNQSILRWGKWGLIKIVKDKKKKKNTCSSFHLMSKRRYSRLAYSRLAYSQIGNMTVLRMKTVSTVTPSI